MEQNKILKGKKVAVLIETEYIAEEAKAYKERFEELGAEVDFLSYLWGENERILVSDVTDPNSKFETMKVTKDVKDANCEDYAIVLIAANYVACRLREIPEMGSLGSTQKLKTPPAVEFIIEAMGNKNIIKGALCHALWLMTPAPEILRGRKVVCHTVVLADIINAGAHFIGDCVDSNENGIYNVMVDDDLVTGRSVADLDRYIEKIIQVYKDKT